MLHHCSGQESAKSLSASYWVPKHIVQIMGIHWMICCHSRSLQWRACRQLQGGCSSVEFDMIACSAGDMVFVHAWDGPIRESPKASSFECAQSALSRHVFASVACCCEQKTPILLLPRCLGTRRNDWFMKNHEALELSSSHVRQLQ